MSRIKSLKARTRSRAPVELLIVAEHGGRVMREPLRFPAEPPEGWPHGAAAWRAQCLREACLLAEAAAAAADDVADDLTIPAEFATDKTRS